MNNTKRTRLQWRIGSIIFAGILLFLLTCMPEGRKTYATPMNCMLSFASSRLSASQRSGLLSQTGSGLL